MQPGITALILICSAALAKPECTVDTATDMLAGLNANTPIECLMNSQALIAQSALLSADKAVDHYLKVICLPSRDVANLRVRPTLGASEVVDDDSDLPGSSAGPP